MKLNKTKKTNLYYKYLITSVVSIALAFSGLLVRFLGINTNTITLVVAISTISMMAISIILFDESIKNTNKETVTSLKTINTSIKTLIKEQSKFFNEVYSHLQEIRTKANVKPRISLRREIKSYAYIFSHYYLWVYNSHARNIEIKIEPRPSDTDGKYFMNEQSEQTFFISDFSKLELYRVQRKIIIKCHGLDGKKYSKTLSFNSISENPTEIELDLM